MRIVSSDTSRSTLPLQASTIMGDTGRITMKMIQIIMDVIGVSTGPNPIGDDIEIMKPT